MQIKKQKLILISAVVILGMFVFANPVAACGRIFHRGRCWRPTVASEDEIFSWVEDLYDIGTSGEYGYRMPGTPSELEAANYVLQKFEESGLEDTFLEPVPASLCLPDEWSLTIHVGDADENIQSYFLRYTAFTPLEGITAEMVYVGTGSESEFEDAKASVGVEGKIVLVDLFGAPWPRAFLKPFILFEWDPDNTFANDPMATENWPLANLDSSYKFAGEYGAVGYIGIINFMADYVNQYLHWYGDGSLPGLTVSKNDGNYLKDLLKGETIIEPRIEAVAGGIEATIVLTGVAQPGETHNVYGILPGESDDIIVIMSHYDGWATNEASGASVVMALANYFGQFPKCTREKTLLFVVFGSHFGKKANWNEYDCLVYDLLPKVACAINIEMIGKQIKVVGGEFVETGLIAPRGMFLSGPTYSANEYLLSYASEAIINNDMERTSILPGAFAVPGEGGKFHALGVPTINYISHNAPQFTQYDTLETVAKDQLVPTTKMFIDIINDIDVTPASLLKWVNTIDSRDVKLYPDLKESVWQLKRFPYGSSDFIGLHRVVKEGIVPKDVVFMLPGTWSNGEQLISNPSTDPWTKDEAHSFAYYLANRGFDVYAIDYRTHFVNTYLNPDDLSFMANWGWDTWISDIKEAVDLAKAVSGVQKIYIAGDSFGGSAAMNFAAKYWDTDLKGILLRDGGTGAKFSELVTNSYDLPKMIEEMEASGTWCSEVGGTSGSIFVMQYADQHPGAPAEFPSGTPLSPSINPHTRLPWSNISEWAAYMIYMSWGPGVVSNIYEGYGDPLVMLHIDATFDRYWPVRLSLESSAISNWDNCPYVSFDFDDFYNEVDVPLLAFTSELFGLHYWGPFRQGIANPDFTGVYLWGYGHLDVYSGEHSESEVSKPTYEWLLHRKVLEGYGSIRIGRHWNSGKTTIYINDTTINVKVNDERVLFNIYFKKSYCKYEYYVGSGKVGKINIWIFKGTNLAIANGRCIYFFGYEI
jgi:pimeloyl-ACP methyl ester carboxylesterase